MAPAGAGAQSGAGARSGADGKSRRPLLGDLLIELLTGHAEPRLAKGLRDELLKKYPYRHPTPRVVRNTLESLARHTAVPVPVVQRCRTSGDPQVGGWRQPVMVCISWSMISHSGTPSQLLRMTPTQPVSG